MSGILLTAFEPFDGWRVNSSQLCLERLSELLAPQYDVTMRVYPVDFVAARQALLHDLHRRPALALHLGQMQRSGCLELEQRACNRGAQRGGAPFELEPQGEPHHFTTIPVAEWVRWLQQEGVPAAVSDDAGQYLCNAVYYWSLHHAARSPAPHRALFVHLPLTPEQAAETAAAVPSLPPEVAARGVARLIEWFGSDRGG
jgi:pyroglutamyl-peptidase